MSNTRSAASSSTKELDRIGDPHPSSLIMAEKPKKKKEQIGTITNVAEKPRKRKEQKLNLVSAVSNTRSSAIVGTERSFLDFNF